MKITNKYDLPASIVNAVTRSSVKTENRISVTDLIGSPLIRQLRIKHWDEIEVDASDMLWALLGTAVHSALQKNAPSGTVVEHKMQIRKDDYTIVGIPDLYDNGILSDWKITSVWSFILGAKPEWERQLNVYAYFFLMKGLPVRKLEINAILRDHQVSKRFDKDYPPIPFVKSDVKLWSPTETFEYILNRLDLHKKPAGICTEEERWTRERTWAVKYKGKKKAIKVEKSLDAIHQYMDDKKLSLTTTTIEERPGIDARCVGYCDVNKFCPYWNEKYKTAEPENDAENT